MKKYVSESRVKSAYRRLEQLIRDPRVPELALVSQLERATKLEQLRMEWVERKRRARKPT